MNASDLREWIGLIAPDLVPDGQGGMRETLPANPQADTPACVEIESGDQVFTADQKESLYRYTVTIRYQDGITPALRIYWAGKWLRMLAVLNLGARNEWLEMSAEQDGKGLQ
jgi:head-tail adaptor